MRNTIKKIFGISMSFLMVPIIKTTAYAEVVTPEIVRTDTWTTSYFIDDDMETLYPYVQCKADIYNNGDVVVSLWNTHEWTGFDNIHNAVTLIECVPKSQESNAYKEVECYQKQGYYDRTGFGIYQFYGFYCSTRGTTFEERAFESNRKLVKPNYFSEYYVESTNFNPSECYAGFNIVATKSDGSYATAVFYNYLRLGDCLATLPTEEKVYEFTYRPRYSINEYYDYNFRVFGHDIKITMDMLSENIIATPQPSKEEKKIAELEEQNEYLQNEIKSLNSQISELLSGSGYTNSKCGDLNDDGTINVLDIVILERYLARSITKLPYK